jgi:hypothetical protein
MESRFLVQHNEISIFSLTDEEYAEAKKHYPELSKQDEFLNFYENSADA